MCVCVCVRDGARRIHPGMEDISNGMDSVRKFEAEIEDLDRIKR